jgi:hypothetical protein
VFKGQQHAELWIVRQEINFRRITVLRTCKSIITDFRLSRRFIVNVDSALGSWRRVGWSNVAYDPEVYTDAASIFGITPKIFTSETSITLQRPRGAKIQEQNKLREALL